MITIYLYPNIIEVQIWDPAIFTTRNQYMYAKPVTIYQGIDNPIQVKVKNQDQKPVNMTNKSIRVDIQDTLNSLTVHTSTVTFSNIAKGYGTFIINKDLTALLDQRQYKLTFRTIDTTNNNAEQPVYVDDNYQVPLDLMVLPAYYADTP
jgi:hypothetical protein